MWLVERGAHVVFICLFKKTGFCTIEVRILGQDRLTYCAAFSNLGVGVSNELITTVPGGRAPSADGRSHRGSGLASTASAHHPQVVEAAAPALAPSEPTTAVSDGRAPSTAGASSHEGSDPAPVANPHRGIRVGGGSNSAFHFSVAASPSADGATATAAPAAATLATSSSPDVTVWVPLTAPRRLPLPPPTRVSMLTRVRPLVLL